MTLSLDQWDKGGRDFRTFELPLPRGQRQLVDWETQREWGVLVCGGLRIVNPNVSYDDYSGLSGREIAAEEMAAVLAGEAQLEQWRPIEPISTETDDDIDVPEFVRPKPPTMREIIDSFNIDEFIFPATGPTTPPAGKRPERKAPVWPFLDDITDLEIDDPGEFQVLSPQPLRRQPAIRPVIAIREGLYGSQPYTGQAITSTNKIVTADDELPTLSHEPAGERDPDNETVKQAEYAILITCAEIVIAIARRNHMAKARVLEGIMRRDPTLSSLLKDRIFMKVLWGFGNPGPDRRVFTQKLTNIKSQVSYERYVLPSIARAEFLKLHKAEGLLMPEGEEA